MPHPLVPYEEVHPLLGYESRCKPPLSHRASFPKACPHLDPFYYSLEHGVKIWLDTISKFLYFYRKSSHLLIMFRYSRSKVLFYCFGFSVSEFQSSWLRQLIPHLSTFQKSSLKIYSACWFLRSSSGWKETISNERDGWDADFWDHPLSEKKLSPAGRVAGPMAKTQALLSGGSLSEGNRCSKCNIWEGVSSNFSP